jgi:hypothetical protein
MKLAGGPRELQRGSLNLRYGIVYENIVVVGNLKFARIPTQGR